jgi:mono/diheme cytochrome c family protein
MKKAFKIGGYIAAGIIVLVVLFIGFIDVSFPKVSPAQSMTIKATPELIARGEYLAHHVSGCIDCHSSRDWTKFDGPIIPGTLGKGGQEFDKEVVNFPGTIVAHNITPYGLKNWTDGDIYRTLTTGVTKDGKALFPLMPYQHFAKMDPEDLKSIIAYIRTLPSVESPQYPYANLNFPLNLIVKTIPQDVVVPGVKPESSDSVKYGEYLVTIASCSDCHTPSNKGEAIPGMDFAGGMEFKSPVTGDIIRSANITQETETGIGLWTEEQFLEKFRAYRDSSWQNKPVKAGEFNTAMPWLFFSGMTDGDLKSIYRYLQTIPPVVHKVEKFTAAK